MNRKMLNLLGALFLILPALSQADYCSEMKEHYWKCARASMIGEACDAADDVSIPSECLNAGSEKAQKETPANSTLSPSSNFFKSEKESKPFVYQPDVTPKKPVKVVNIKPENRKIYIETEEEVEQFTTKIRDDLLKAMRDGKRVRLKFE